MASVSEPAASEPVIQASSEPVLEIQAKEADPTQKKQRRVLRANI